MTYRTLFLDIDGTILKPDHTYSESTKKAIEQVQAKGIEVFLATGRPLHEITELTNELNVHSFIGYNGGYATYNNEVIVNEPIDVDIIKQYLEISQSHDHEIVFYTNEKNYFTSLQKPVVQHFIEAFQLKYNERFTDRVIDQILSITLMNLETHHVSLYELTADIQLAQVNIEGLRHAYDLIQTNVNKGKAIEKVIHHLKIKREQTIAFGDGLNDKQMLEVVGEGVAMGNAHPDLLPYAKHVTTSVEEDGIYHGLKKLGII